MGIRKLSYRNNLRYTAKIFRNPPGESDSYMNISRALPDAYAEKVLKTRLVWYLFS